MSWTLEFLKVRVPDNEVLEMMVTVVIVVQGFVCVADPGWFED